MKKTLCLLGLLIFFSLFGVLLYSVQNRTVQLEMDESAKPVLCLKANNAIKELKPWFNKREGIYYFFLPSFVTDYKIFGDRLKKNDITINGESISGWNSFCWESEKIYTMSCNGQKYEIVFIKSSNIPSLFVETESGSMEAINTDKEYAEAGKIALINAAKNVEYQGNLKKFSARGNSTFDDKDKKAYSFTLNDSYPLCEMDAGKKWNLLALYFEYDKIHTKLVYDMADALGMEYNIDCTWVDLYCNGEYQGLYLLTEAVTVGKGRVEIHDLEKERGAESNISGGYLLEKDVEVHLEQEGNGFVTEQCNYPFIVKSPDFATEQELDYIKTYMQTIENLLVLGDKKYKEYVDLDSFAKQFLIDKIVLEPDAMSMSTFYYKNVDSDILKVGPLWDYDRAFGGSLPNYELSIGDYPDSMHDWYMELYEDEEFREKMISYYKELLPFFEKMLNSGIDKYAEWIHGSVKMDSIKWPNYIYQSSTMSYLEYDSYIKYLKYFLANRLNYLNEVWEISECHFETPVSGSEEHRVEFILDDGSLIETRNVLDGECMDMTPELGEEYSGWGFWEDGKKYSSFIPIYENTILKARRRFNSAEEQYAYKMGCLNAAPDLLTYMELLDDRDFSVCVYVNKDTDLTQRKEIMTALKEICDYKHPDWLDKELEMEQDYFLLIDNGWGRIWDSVNGESLGEISTTFGPVSYGTAEKGSRYLYIQGNEINYLSEEMQREMVFVVINRYSGEILDIRSFGED